MSSVIKMPAGVDRMRPALAQQLMDLEREWIGLESQYRKTPQLIADYYKRRKPVLKESIRKIREAMK